MVVVVWLDELVDDFEKGWIGEFLLDGGFVFVCELCGVKEVCFIDVVFVNSVEVCCFYVM